MTHPLLQSPNIFSKYLVSEILDRLNQLVTEGYVSCRPHPNYPQLRIFNYTDKCTYDKHWNEFTLSARGLIIDVDAKRLVALPFPKIFNYSELGIVNPADLPSVDSVVEKMDGSLGIIFFYNGLWHVATRGSFESEQAIWATAKLRGAIDQGLVLEQNYTYLMELIYPANRIVVNYNETEAMVYLDAYDLRSYKRVGEIGFAPFKQFTPSYNYFFSAPARFPHITLDNISTILNGPWPNFEGFVVIFSNGCRVKFKTKEYCELHRIKFGLTPLAVWEAMVTGTIEAYGVQVPEEFRTLFETYHRTLKTNFHLKLLESYQYFMNALWSLPFNETFQRAKFAEQIRQMPNQGILWMMYDYFVSKKLTDRSIFENKVLHLVRPDGNVL